MVEIILVYDTWRDVCRADRSPSVGVLIYGLVAEDLFTCYVLYRIIASICIRSENLGGCHQIVITQEITTMN